MMSGKAGVLIAVSLVSLASGAWAGDPSQTQRRLTPADIKSLPKIGAGAGTSGVEGIKTTILWGDPTKPGPYTIALEVPANTRIAAHTHRDDRSAVVVSGTWLFGYGAKAEEAALKPLSPGSFYTEPANDPHFAGTAAEPAIVYITGVGPTDTHYTAIDARKP